MFFYVILPVADILVYQSMDKTGNIQSDYNLIIKIKAGDEESFKNSSSDTIRVSDTSYCAS